MTLSCVGWPRDSLESCMTLSWLLALQERFPESESQGLMRLGLSSGAHYPCRERQTQAGEESRPWCSQNPGPHSGLGCPRPPFLPLPLPEEGLRYK